MDKHRVILDLSFPYCLLVNDNIDRQGFDNDKFTLIFPGVDNIVKKILKRND